MTLRFLTPVRVALIFLLVFGLAALRPASACTRCVYLGSNSIVLTARSMDWAEDIKSNLWVFPRGMKRNGATGAGTLNWVSKYGSVVVSGYDIGTADGINEQGLVANLLYLAESDYGKADATSTTVSIGAWGQYVLDSCGTVYDVVELLGKTPLVVIAPVLPNGSAASLHLAVSDPTGDSAVFEYVGGKLVIHHGKEFKVMTNSPVFDQQLALNQYWEKIGGTAFLPGTSRASDRFARTSFYLHAIPETDQIQDALASVFGVIRGASVPLGMATTPGEPNVSPTRWRTVADQKNKIYYFDDATRPSVFWVKLADLDLREGQPARKLQITDGKPFAGNVAKEFTPAEPFAFLGSGPH